MDVQREIPKQKLRSKRLGVVIAVSLLALFGLIYTFTLDPAVPQVARQSVLLDTVRRGDMLIELQAPGRLVPENPRLITSRSDGTVTRIHHLSGARVEEDTVILELENPTLKHEYEDSLIGLKVESARLASVVGDASGELYRGREQLARLSSDQQKAAVEADVARSLADTGVIPAANLRKMQIESGSLRRAVRAQEQLVNVLDRDVGSRAAVQRAVVERARQQVRYLRDLVVNLKVRAGTSGILQAMEADVGQQIKQGMGLGSVVRQEELKAELRVQESEAGQLALGQSAMLDINGVRVPGRISRIDPAVENGTVKVDIKPSQPLPAQARVDLRIDGTIQIKRLSNALYVGRPSQLPDGNRVSLFRIDGDRARQQTVKVGARSASKVQILSGLRQGDAVIISDTGQWQKNEVITLTD